MHREDAFSCDFASRISISLIDSPLYNQLESTNFDDELKIYFQTTRWLRINDHISFMSILDNVPIQFKIVSVDPETLINTKFKADSHHTSLIQTEGSIKDKWIWNNNIPSKSLNVYVDKIVKLINFHKYFNESSQNSLPILLLYGPVGSGKTRIVENVCANMSAHLLAINGVNLAGDTAASVEKRCDIFFQKASNYDPCIILIKSCHFVFRIRDLNESNKRLSDTFFTLLSNLKQKCSFFIICTCESKQQLDTNILSNFNSEIEIKSLDVTQRESFLNEEKLDINRELFVKKTNGLIYGEMKTLVDLIRLESSSNSSFIEDDVFENTLKHFNENRKFKQENKLNIDNITWKDVGGLNEIKKIIMDTIVMPLNFPDLFSSSGDNLGINRSGILLYGPPGTGKTLLAKAICSQCQLNFLSVKGPELLDMYVGQTELNVRNLFEKARQNAPCVLFFDELDSLAPIRGKSGDSGGVMDRVVSQLLSEIDGLDKHSSDGNTLNQIFIIGATNRPDLIDPSLLRPGRFDKLAYVAVPKEKHERKNILLALTRKLNIDKSFSIDEFIDKCPENMTGADFYSVTNKARQNALKRLIGRFNDSLKDNEIIIIEDDFNKSLTNFVPTLTKEMLKEYEKYFYKYSSANS